MADFNAPFCVAEVGLLVLSKCGKRAAGKCSICGMPFCRKHLIDVEGGVMCPACADKSGASMTSPEASSLVSRVRRRRRYYRDYDYYGAYYPYYYYDNYYYDRGDYRSVESDAQDPQDGGADGEDFDSDYDFTES